MLPQVPHPSEGTSSYIGIALAVSASVLIAAGLNVQRLAHLRRQHRPPTSSSSAPPASPVSCRPPSTFSLDSTESHPSSRAARSGRTHERTPLLVSPAVPALKRTLSDPEPSFTNPQILVPLISEATPSPPVTRRSSRTRSSSHTRRPRTDKGFIRSRLWLAGFLLLNVGEFLNFLAYGFAQPSVVAPLGMVTLVANVFLAPLIVKEPFRKKDLVGVAIAMLGGATVVYASRSSDKKLWPDELLQAISQPLFIAYVVVSAVLIVVLAYLSQTRLGDRFVLIDLSLCATAGAFTVLATKAISGFLNLDPIRTVKSWLTYPVLAVLALTAFTQVMYVNKSLQRFESRIVIPIQYCTFALSTIIGSAVLYRDFDGLPFPSFLNFAFGCVVCGLGVYLLTRSSSSPSSSSSSSANHSHLPVVREEPANPSSTNENDPVSPIRPSKSVPFPSSGTFRSTSGRLLPVPVVARGRKASLTLGSAYLLVGSPSGREEENDEEEGMSEEGMDEEERAGS